MINVYMSTEMDFAHNGLTPLIPSFCIISEELNGRYEIELVHPIDDVGRWRHLNTFNIIRAPTPKHGYQLFRIYQPGKMLNGGIKVNARHIFYDLIYNHIKKCNINNLNCTAAVNGILASTLSPHRFKAASDITSTAAMLYELTNPVACIMDGDDSVLGLYGGEIVRDNYNIGIMQSIGTDKGIQIRYRKNLTGLEVTENVENTITRLIPYSGDVYLSEYYMDSPRINDYPYPLIQSVEFTDIKGNIRAQLREKAQQMFDNGADLPELNVKVEFVNLEKTEEHKDYALLETVNLGDTVTVIHEGLDVNIKAKCISYVYNCLTERYDKIELGQSKENLSGTALEASRAVNKVSATDLVAQAARHDLGGYVLKQYDELLIIDTRDINTASKVYKLCKDGILHSKDNGKTWHIVFDMDGKYTPVP